ncbi:hypothetical protein FRC17_006289, partial [Serendipita sp. 399]
MSRYPAMSQRPAAYDQSLLVGAPALSRQDRQAGYDINALEQGSYASPVAAYSSNSQGAAATSTSQYISPVAPAAANANPFVDSVYERERTPSLVPPPKRPWWKTKRGRWGLFFGLVVFIGIIAGIAAGAGAARDSRNRTLLNDSSQNASPSSPAANAGSSSLSQTPPPALSPSPSPSSSSSSSIIPLASSVSNDLPPATITAPSGNGVPTGETIVIGPGLTSTIGAPNPAIPTPPSQIPGSGPGTGSGSIDDIPPICYLIPTS